MSNTPTVPGAVKSLSFILPLPALTTLALGGLLISSGVISVGMAGNPMGYLAVAMGLVLAVCALVMIAAIIILRRRSRVMRIALTVSCLITIGIATSVAIEYLSLYSRGDDGYTVLDVLVAWSLPLLLVIGSPLAVLVVLWAAPSTRAFFKVSSPRV